MSSDLTWFKSGYSNSEGGECVEVATDARTVHVRDSKDPSGPCLAFTSEAWSEFVAFTLRSGDRTDEARR